MIHQQHSHAARRLGNTQKGTGYTKKISTRNVNITQLPNVKRTANPSQSHVCGVCFPFGGGLLVCTFCFSSEGITVAMNHMGNRNIPSSRGVKLIFTGGHISLAVAFKGPNVILGLYKRNYSLTVKRVLGATAG